MSTKTVNKYAECTRVALLCPLGLLTLDKESAVIQNASDVNMTEGNNNILNIELCTNALM